MTRVAVVVVLGVLLCGCQDSSPSSTAGKTPVFVLVDLRGREGGGAYPEVDVSVKDNVFSPNAIRIDAGTTVKWANQGQSDHNLKSADGTVDFGGPFGVVGSRFSPGSTYEFTFKKPGVYTYFCSFHGTPQFGMVGVVVVGNVPFDPHAIASGAKSGTRGGTLRVPAEFPTIQAAVDAAKPGSLVLVSPGVYREAVTITTPNLVVRGLSRANTVVDGEFKRDNGFKVIADGVAIENMTARRFTLNGFYWSGVAGYRGSYLDAVRNGEYGIYAFDSKNGEFDHDYAAGSPDGGFYIGQCNPCNAVIIDSISEWNGLGYSGTNAGGNLTVARSVFRDNRVGIVPDSSSGEANPPQHGATIIGNTVFDNNNGRTAAIPFARIATGNGILVAGGNDDLVERNLVYDQRVTGIAVVPLPEKILTPADPHARNFDARRNQIRDNLVRGSGLADLVSISTIANARDSGDNCFAGNTFATSLPAKLQELLQCGHQASTAFAAALPRFAEVILGSQPPAVDYRNVTLPPPPNLADLPDAAHAAAQSATPDLVPTRIDLDAVQVPRI